jgi:hypothetical protein
MPDPAPKPLALIVAACALALSAAEQPANRSDAGSLRSCFEPPSAGTSWTPLDDHTILVRAGVRAFKVTTNSCPRLADPLARITVVIGGGTSICSPRDAHIYVSDSADRQGVPCFAQSISPVSLDEARMMEQAHRH